MKLILYSYFLLLSLNVLCVDYQLYRPAGANYLNLKLVHDVNARPIISFSVENGVEIHGSNSPENSIVFRTYIDKIEYGMNLPIYDKDNKNEIVIIGTFGKRILSTIWLTISQRTAPIMHMYRLNYDGLFLNLYSQSENDKGMYPDFVDSPTVFYPKIIPLERTEQYTKLLFPSTKINNNLGESTESFGLKDESYYLYKISDSYFIIKPQFEYASGVAYTLDFSDPHYQCKIEGYMNDQLIMQIAYKDDYNISAIAFSKIGDKEVIVRCNRTGREDISVEYVVTDTDGIYLYKPVLNLAEAKFEPPACNTPQITENPVRETSETR